MKQFPTIFTRPTALPIAIAALATSPLISCGPSDIAGSHADGETPVELHPSEPARSTGNQQATIRGSEFRGVAHGTSLADLKSRFGENLKKDVERNGEGDFNYYGLNEGGAEIMRFFLSDADKVDVATTQHSAFKTDQGVGVGSTLADLRAAYPDIVIHGSETEGWTSATSASARGVSFEIGSHFWHHELSEKEVASIPPGTKIETLIILTGRP